MDIKFEPADIILVHRDHWFNNSIALALRIFQRDKVNFSHVILSCGGCRAIELGGFPGCVREIDINSSLSKYDSYLVIRRSGISYDEKIRIVKKASKCLGKSYNHIRIIAQLLDQIFRTNRFTKITGHSRKHICSSFVAWAYYVVCRVIFNGIKWYSVEPDDIEDEVENNTHLYKVWRKE